MLGEGTTPCLLGAVKTNFGHLEAASGVVGLIKAALTLEHEEIPPNAGFEVLNPHISLEGTRFAIPIEPRPWPRGPEPRFAGVSSFGFSGTNAHVVLEEAPRVPVGAVEAGGLNLLTISARTPAVARRPCRCATPGISMRRRSRPPRSVPRHRSAVQHVERLAVVGGSRAELRDRPARCPRGPAGLRHRGGRAAGSRRRRIRILRAGVAMGADGTRLHQREPVFRAALEEFDRRVHERAGWSVLEVLAADEADSLLDRTQYAQPAIFAVQVALVRLWAEWGVAPSVVIGHSRERSPRPASPAASTRTRRSASSCSAVG